MKNKMERQAVRGTLRIYPGHNNNSVFQIFGNNLRKDLRHPEALMRLRYGVGNTNVERLVVVLFKALKAGEFQVSVRSTDDEIEKLFSPSSIIRCYKVRDKVFRRTIESVADAERVLDELGIKFIRMTGPSLSKKEREKAFELLNRQDLVPELL